MRIARTLQMEPYKLSQVLFYVTYFPIPDVIKVARPLFLALCKDTTAIFGEAISSLSYSPEGFEKATSYWKKERLKIYFEPVSSLKRPYGKAIKDR